MHETFEKAVHTDELKAPIITGPEVKETLYVKENLGTFKENLGTTSLKTETFAAPLQ